MLLFSGRDKFKTGLLFASAFGFGLATDKPTIVNYGDRQFFPDVPGYTYKTLFTKTTVEN